MAETFKIAESASKSEQRRIFKKAMKFIKDNDIKDLIVEKVDRHVRNFHDAEKLTIGLWRTKNAEFTL